MDLIQNIFLIDIGAHRKSPEKNYADLTNVIFFLLYKIWLRGNPTEEIFMRDKSSIVQTLHYVQTHRAKTGDLHAKY